MNSGQCASAIDFNAAFEGLTGHSPFQWQRRLFDEYLSLGHLPQAVDIPTGLGKTAVMVVWLLARAAGATLPRRLIYVVDRRAVVDQATEFAEQIRSTLQDAKQNSKSLDPVRSGLGLHDGKLAISTLRGRYVDNREWMADPAAPAIIVGTVDMVGSRLLFQGYGVSQKMRSYAAGLMGCDSLVILDEAHLARPFEHLLRRIEQEQRPVSAKEPHTGSGLFACSDACEKPTPPFHMLPLSATMNHDSSSDLFGLRRDIDWEDKTVRMRLDAAKALSIEDLPKQGSLPDKLSERAWQLTHGENGLITQKSFRMLIYCDLRSDAEKTANSLQKLAKKEQCNDKVILFVGGRRIHEREQAANEMKSYGFIGDSCKNDAPVFVVATSAGEVGVDLDAHHMICDLVPWERMIQRLGRVNRRGIGQARVLVIDQSKNEKKGDEDKRNRLKTTRKLLESLAKDSDGCHQAGPTALLALRDEPIYHQCILAASTCPPLYPALTRPLVDSWSMTSLDEDSGRPEVSPWLRGWVKEEAQTTIVWRHYLPVLFSGQAVPRKHARGEVIDFFEAAPPQTEELLEVETSRAVQWLKKRVKQLKLESEGTSDAGVSCDMIAPLREETPMVFLLDHKSRPVDIDILTLSEIKKKKTNDLQQIFTNQQIIIDSRIGGIADGLLRENSSNPVCTIEDNWKELNHENSQEHRPPIRVRTLRESERAKSLEELQILQQNSSNTAQSWRETLALPYCISPEEDSTKVWLVVEQHHDCSDGEEAKAIKSKAQRLDEHQAWAAEEAARLADKIGLDKDDRTMLMAAARHHDDGKKAQRWQRAFNAQREGGPYAKTAGPFNRYVLNGYRHELKSALDAETNGLDGIDRADPRFELLLHLIASHHGYARPSISIKGYDDLPPSETAKRAHDIALRFARLQRKWGPWGLAWWEALMRAVDQRASRRLDQQVSCEHAQPDSAADLQRQTFAHDLEVVR